MEFGDLTVVVGPQASGKSILLATLKLVLDRDHIHHTFARHNVTFNGGGNDMAAFLGGYFGKGMAALRKDGSAIAWKGKEVLLASLVRYRKRPKAPEEKVFFIPAQRVVSLPGGVSQHFSNFNYGDPYVLRHFSDTVHNLLQNEFGAKAELFPQSGRLNNTLRQPISDHLFGGANLEIDTREFTKTLVIRVPGHEAGLPFLAWSAGQREFTPLLLGIYWLCPAGAVSRREGLEWVVIEEPEMGLHPQAIATLLLLVLELMRRGYRVVISTHSPVVLDMVWALRQFQELGSDESLVRELFGLRATANAKALAKSALAKSYRVYFFDRNQAVRDISRLDPGAESGAEAEWGGLVGFASRAGEMVAKAVNRQRAEQSRSARSGRKEPVA
ncbi:AAA family ATPase [Vulcaniibacterium thermophilum]|nr:ATP-binding protein [Vulcaniibacterium thermophilum]